MTVATIILKLSHVGGKWGAESLTICAQYLLGQPSEEVGGPRPPQLGWGGSQPINAFKKFRRSSAVTDLHCLTDSYRGGSGLDT